ncbi:MAG: tRNA 2-thiouridine(34) synthase MnmA [Fidelibacterota bacterium]
MKQRVIVGMSGGVDSSVAALLLQEKGFEVECVFMQNWDEGPDDPCTSEEDYQDALAVCNTLNLPLRSVNFTREYWDRVFTHFLNEYQAGRTPNPDVLCNKEIKFNAFLDYAKELGADLIATGHYARIEFKDDRYYLLKGLDSGKDQSYFLYLLTQSALSRSLFPVGKLKKSQVRQLAEETGLITSQKKDSTGVCFIGEQKSFKNFLMKYLSPKPGYIVTKEGTVCGQHDGLMFYTLGQRKGLGIGGGHGALEAPWFVAEKDQENNQLIVVQGRDNPVLYSQSLTASQLHWISGSIPNNLDNLKAKIRYRQSDQHCEIIELQRENCRVRFQSPQFAVTPGQSIVFYRDDECLGGGIIEERFQD